MTHGGNLVRRFSLYVAGALLLGLLAMLAPAPPADGAAAQAETVTVGVSGVKTITLAQPAAHVAVYWVGGENAHVTLAFSSDGTTFVQPIEAGRDDAGEELRNGKTYGAVHAAGGSVAVRVTTDTPLASLTVVGIPAGDDLMPGLLFAAEDFPDWYSPADEPSAEETPTEETPTEPEPAPGIDQPTIITRTAWGADPLYLTWAPRFQPATKIIVHHTADGSNPDGSPESYAKLIRAIYYYHAVTQDWGDIAYNYLIDPLGNLYEGRYSDDNDASPIGEDLYGNAVVGGHCYNYNTGTIGIAVLGTYRDHEISAAACAALEQLIAWLVERDGINPLGADPYLNPFNSSANIQTWNIAGHCDYRSTDCPGAAFYKMLPSIRQAVFSLTGPVAASTPPPTYIDLDMSASTSAVGQQVTATAQLIEDSSRTPIPGQPISFFLGARSSESTPLETVITDANGVATLRITCTSAQMQWVTAVFDTGPDPAAAYRGTTTCAEIDVAPSGLVATAGDALVQLSWTPEPLAGSYNVYRNGKKLNSAPVTSAGYLDVGLKNGATYSYQVTAIVSGRESIKSATASVSPNGPVEAPLFPDVDVGYLYYAAVQDLALNGIINGAPGGLFLPGDPVTRQQFAKMIVLGGDYPVSEYNVCTFKDVAKGGAATLYPDNYVAVCAANGITIGKTATRFDPYTSITRAQVLTMVVRAGQDFKPSAIEEPPSGWKGVLSTKDPTHGANIARAEYNGLLSGIDLSKFSVNGKATRGEIAQVIWNLRSK
jgi:hypothetical protein